MRAIKEFGFQSGATTKTEIQNAHSQAVIACGKKSEKNPILHVEGVFATDLGGTAVISDGQKAALVNRDDLKIKRKSALLPADLKFIFFTGSKYSVFILSEGKSPSDTNINEVVTQVGARCASLPEVSKR